jgi:putative transcriptional regulator
MITCQLSTLLGARRMTQVRLAALTGIHRDIIRKLYHDNWTSIRRDTPDRLCDALQVSVSELLVWVPDQHSEATSQPRSHQ